MIDNNPAQHTPYSFPAAIPGAPNVIPVKTGTCALLTTVAPAKAGAPGRGMDTASTPDIDEHLRSPPLNPSFRRRPESRGLGGLPPSRTRSDPATRRNSPDPTGLRWTRVDMIRPAASLRVQDRTSSVQSASRLKVVRPARHNPRPATHGLPSQLTTGEGTITSSMPTSASNCSGSVTVARTRRTSRRVPDGAIEFYRPDALPDMALKATGTPAVLFGTRRQWRSSTAEASDDTCSERTIATRDRLPTSRSTTRHATFRPLDDDRIRCPSRRIPTNIILEIRAQNATELNELWISFFETKGCSTQAGGTMTRHNPRPHRPVVIRSPVSSAPRPSDALHRPRRHHATDTSKEGPDFGLAQSVRWRS